MRQIGVRELKQNASSILRLVRERKEWFEITHRGRVIATLSPSGDPSARRQHDLKIWAEMDETARKIGELWPEGVSAADAVDEQRR